jgi:hypothetical protein
MRTTPPLLISHSFYDFTTRIFKTAGRKVFPGYLLSDEPVKFSQTVTLSTYILSLAAVKWVMRHPASDSVKRESVQIALSFAFAFPGVLMIAGNL